MTKRFYQKTLSKHLELALLAPINNISLHDELGGKQLTRPYTGWCADDWQLPAEASAE